jgi:hypothetical protein
MEGDVFVVFFLLAIFFGFDGIQIYNSATTIMQQIAGASIGSTGLVMLFAAVLDCWAWSFRHRMMRIETQMNEMPKAIATEIDAILSARAAARSRE